MITSPETSLLRVAAGWRERGMQWKPGSQRPGDREWGIEGSRSTRDQCQQQRHIPLQSCPCNQQHCSVLQREVPFGDREWGREGSRSTRDWFGGETSQWYYMCSTSFQQEVRFTVYHQWACILKHFNFLLEKCHRYRNREDAKVIPWYMLKEKNRLSH